MTSLRQLTTIRDVSGAYRDTHTVHHITPRAGNRRVYRYEGLAVPPAAISDWPANRMSATESGQPFPLGIPHPQAAPPVELHALGFGDGEQRVRHESVIAEHSEIVSAHAGHSTPAVPA